jgi:hypothetical protein
MTPQEAKKYLKQYLDTHNNVFPIVDEIALRLHTPLVISDITFVGLLCIAYDLRPIEKHEIEKL